MKRYGYLARAAMLASLIFWTSGCETEPSEQISVSISPNTAQLRLGESQEFVASGWEDYTWSLGTPGIGVLSTKKGNSTIYTAVTGTNDVQTLTLTVNVRGAPSTNTIIGVTGSSLISSQALIQHAP